jgi:integrase
MATKKSTSRKHVKVSKDSKEYLRLQFSSGLSQEIWGKRQYYKALGLSDSEENRIKAEEIANQIEQDILFGRLDASLQKYSIVVQAATKAEKIHPYYRSDITLQKLFAMYLQYIKPQKAETTFIRKYEKLFANTISKCPQDIKDTAGIQAKITELRCRDHAKALLGQLDDMMTWAKINKTIPDDFPNPYKFYKENINNKKPQPKPIPSMVMSCGAIKPQFKCRGFKPEEIPCILEALSERGDYRNKGQWRIPVEFLFMTGFRLGEAAGLQWKNVEKDFNYIYVCQSYEPDYDILKGTKTGVTRYFPCNQQIKEFLRRIKPVDVNPEWFVLGGEKPINFNKLNSVWGGHPYKTNKTKKNKTVASLIGNLIAEGKVEFYYPPYGTRHTWINIQLSAGIPVQNVAEWAGNSPDVIWKNYVGYDNKFSHPIELPIGFTP